MHLTMNKRERIAVINIFIYLDVSSHTVDFVSKHKCNFLLFSIFTERVYSCTFGFTDEVNSV